MQCSAWFQAGRIEEARSALERAWPRIPADAWALQVRVRLQWFACCLSQQDPAGAYEQAHALLAMEYRTPAILQGLLWCCEHQGHHIEAAQLRLQLAQDSPAEAEARFLLAECLRNHGSPVEALARFQAIAANPDNPLRHRARYESLILKRQLCDWAHWSEDTDWLHSQVLAGADYINPYLLLTAERFSPADILACAQHYARGLCANTPNARHAAATEPFRVPRKAGRHRVGLLSSDFGGHAVSHLIADVLAYRNTQRFETWLYTLRAPAHADALFTRCVSNSDGISDLSTSNDDEAADRIAADGVSILIDLNGHTRHARPGILARRPAPLQLHWLGYPGTLGNRQLVDGYLGDATVTPLAHQPHYAETLINLPLCYQPGPWPTSPDHTNASGSAFAKEATRLRERRREQAGLPCNAPVLVCFNQSYKITPLVFALWCALMQRAPQSVIWLLDPGVAVGRANLVHAMAKHGISADRVVWAPRVPLAEHKARLSLADLGLDTFPYTSHTTCRDLLEAGVPMVARIGSTLASRVSASLLFAAGLQDWVVESGSDWLERSSTLLQDSAKADLYRRQLAHAMSHHSVFNPHAYAQAWNAVLEAFLE